ncbi:hypothetical protein Droror1_Dr00001554 [Drosera rotundifolia]
MGSEVHSCKWNSLADELGIFNQLFNFTMKRISTSRECYRILEERLGVVFDDAKWGLLRRLRRSFFHCRPALVSPAGARVFCHGCDSLCFLRLRCSGVSTSTAMCWSIAIIFSPYFPFKL